MVATIGPVAGVAVHVELGYYPEGSSLIPRWGTAKWNTTGAWESGTPPRDDISCDIEKVDITTGRDQPLDRFRSSTCSVTLNDPAGKYSPWATATNTPSYTVIRPGIDLFVWIETATDTYYRFAGRVDSITDLWPEPSPDLDARHQVVFQAHDMLGELAAFDGVELPLVGAGELTGARVGRILTNAGYVGPRTLDVGTVTVQATTLAKNTVDEVGITTDTEQGAFFADGEGELRFLDRNGLHADTRYTTVQAIFGEGVRGDVWTRPSAAYCAATPYGGQVPALAVDGDPATWWQPVAGSTGIGFGMVRGEPAPLPPVTALRGVWYPTTGPLTYYPTDYQVAGWDGTNWNILVNHYGNTSDVTVDTFPPDYSLQYAYFVISYQPDGGTPQAHLALKEVDYLAHPTDELCYTDIQLASDSTKVRNLVSIGRVNGAMADRADLDSQAMFGVRTYRRTDLMHETDALSPGIADAYLQTFAYAANRVERLTVNPTVHPEQLDACLALGPLQLIEVRRRTRGFQAVATLQIEAVTESIAPHDWTIEYTTFPATGVFDVGRWDRDTWGHGEWGY